jgi:hypothetical protein
MRVLAVTTCQWLLTGATVGAIDSGKMPVPILNGQVNDAANVRSIEDQERGTFGSRCLVGIAHIIEQDIE